MVTTGAHELSETQLHAPHTNPLTEEAFTLVTALIVTPGRRSRSSDEREVLLPKGKGPI